MTTLNEEGLVDGIARPVDPISITPVPIGDPPVIVPAPTTVPAPTNLQASAAQGRVTLTWQDNSNNEDGFRIRRRGQNDADFVDLAEVGPNVTTYADTTVQPQTTYTYRVRSVRNGGVSNDVTVTTPGTSQRRASSSAEKGGQSVVAGGRISIPIGQFQYFVNGIPTLEFVNASAVLVPPEPTARISIFPPNPIETFTNRTLTLRTEIDTPARTYDIIVTGQSTDVPGPVGAYPPQTIRVEVLPAPTVTLSVDPMNQTIRVGDTATYQVRLQRARAEGEAVELEVNDNLPDGVTATFDPPAPTSDSARLTITTDRTRVPVNLEEIELRIRSRTSGIKVAPTSARLRFKPEASFTAMPTMDTVKRGGSKKFRVLATRMYYDGTLKLDLSVRGNRPSFTATIRPDNFSSGSEFEVEIKISSDTKPDDYTFVATPRFPEEAKDGIATEATIKLKVEDAVAPVVVRVPESFINLRRGRKREVNLQVDPSTYAGPVTVTLLKNDLPSGVTVDSPTTFELRRGPELFILEAADNAAGNGALGFSGTVKDRPDVPVQFMPEKLPVNVLTAGSVIVDRINSLPVDLGEPAEYVVVIESVEYTGTVQVQVSNAPGPVTFQNGDSVSLGPPRSGRVRFSIGTDGLEPGKTYPFQIFATAIPPAEIPNLPLQATVVVERRPEPTMQPPAAPTPTLAAPTNLRATLAGRQVNLRWNDNSEEEGFRIDRRAMNGGYQPIATVPRGATSFADASVTAGATYFYRVRAFAGAVESLPSNEIGVSVPLPRPVAAVRLSAAPVTQRVPAGAIATVTVALARTNYTGPVELTVDGLPFGAIATFSDDPARGNSSILTIATAENGSGLYRLTVRGTASEVNVEPAFLTVNVAARPGFPTGPVSPFPRPIFGRDLRPGVPNADVDLDLNS